MGEAAQSHQPAVEIEMPKSTTECRIKSFTRVENMNVEKLRDI